MRIIVDADACPSLQSIASLAHTYNLDCHLFCDHTHFLQVEYAHLHYISQGFQMVDIAISNFIEVNDILITQDYGLACIALSKKAKAINPNGIIYTNQNIDNLLEQKYINSENRKKNIRTKNIAKRTKETNQKFLLELENMINFTRNL